MSWASYFRNGILISGKARMVRLHDFKKSTKLTKVSLFLSWLLMYLGKSVLDHLVGLQANFFYSSVLSQYIVKFHSSCSF